MPVGDPLSIECKLLRGGDATSRLIAVKDWSATPVGAMAQWPRSLKTVVAMIARTPTAMVLLWGPDGTMFYNDGYAAICGARHPMALGSDPRHSWPEIADFNDSVIQAGLRGESQSFTDQPLTVRRNGVAEDAWFTLHYTPVLGDDDQPAGTLAMVVETTATMQAENFVRTESQRMRAADQRNRQILDSATDYAIFAFDPDGKVTRWNEGAHRILGWTEAEMLGKDAERIFTPEDVAAGRMATEMHAALTEGAGNDERWHLRKSGERFWAAGEMMPLRDDSGRATGFVKVLRDRTRAHQAAEALRQSEERLRRAQEAGGVGTFAVDLQHNLLHVTDEFCRLYGVPLQDSYAPDVIEQLVLPEDTQWRSSVDSRRDQSAALKVQYRIRRADDGRVRWLARNADYEHDAQGRVVRLVGTVQDITEQKAAQLAVLDSAAQFRVLAEALPNHVWTAQPSGLLDWFNDRVYGYSGMQPPTLDGTGWTQLVHPEDRGAAAALWAASLASGTAYETEFRVRRADGAYRWHLVRALPLRSADGAVTRWVGTNTDIHENKLAHAESTRDRNRIWTLSQELMLVCDFNGLISAVNPSATRLLGWLPDEMIGKQVATFVHPDDLGRTAVEGRLLAEGKPTTAFENRYRAKDGSWRMLDWTAVPDNGLVHAVARDITAERAASAERERILTTTNDLMGTVGPDGSLGSINPAWERLLGYAQAQMLGRPLADFIESQDKPVFNALCDRLLHRNQSANANASPIPSPKPVHVEFRLRHKDGAQTGGRQTLVAWSVQPGGDLLYLVGRNVTEQRAAEDALRQSQKMEAVGQLTGGIAHDFNNLLQGITGSLELVQKRIAQDRTAEAESYLGKAMGAARRAAALTHRLLAFSRRQPLDPKPLQANALVASMDDLIRRTLGQRIQFETVLTSELWLTRCDSNQLENAILNLAINARDAMPDGGKLVIETHNASLDSSFAATQDGIQPGRYVCVSVTDTGAGMSADTLGKAFEPFFTTKPIGQGTGLGLSMIYGFARQSEGYAKIYSELGRGTTFRLYLPQYRGDAERDEPLPELSDMHRSVAREVVLVVEDEPDIRELIVEVLSDLDYVALEAADGPAGLAVLQTGQRIDLLVTDIGLPGLNGSQLADAARLLRPELQILFMTGYAEHAAVSAGFLQPGMAMITKPFTMEAMAARIQDIVTGR